MQFKKWLTEAITANSQIKPLEHGNVVDPNQLAVSMLKKHFKNDFQQAIARYDFKLDKISDSYGEVRFKYIVTPIGGREIENKKVFKTPKEAVETIPNDPNLGYRGMSWEEWQNINKKGFIQSNSSYNFVNQKNFTFYGDAETAEYYANSFSPIQFMTSKKRPSVIIAIPRKFLHSNKEYPDIIPGRELAHIGPLSSKEIVSAWLLAPNTGKQGVLELVSKWVAEKDKTGDYTGNYQLANPTEGTRFSPVVRYSIMKIK